MKQSLLISFFFILLQSNYVDHIHTIMSKRNQFTVEIPIRCSPHILFEFLSTPAGLQEWFADEVNQRGDDSYYFTWNGATDEADLVEKVEEEFVRFRWDYYDENEFFEFRIIQSDVTNETILQITDFADKTDVKDAQQLWMTQVNDLKHRVGS